MIFYQSAVLTSRVVIAAFFTIFLFLLMRFLITPDDGVPQKIESSPMVSITRQERDENTQRKQRNKIEKPEQQAPPPPPQLIQHRPQRVSNNTSLAIELPEFDDGGMDELGAPGDRRAIPIVRIPPQYPNRPLSRGIEGWVILEFTITSTGTVEDVRVIDSDPARVFDRSAIRAIQRWKYQPKLVDGKPVPQPNMREQVTYQIED